MVCHRARPGLRQWTISPGLDWFGPGSRHAAHFAEAGELHRQRLVCKNVSASNDRGIKRGGVAKSNSSFWRDPPSDAFNLRRREATKDFHLRAQVDTPQC